MAVKHFVNIKLTQNIHMKTRYNLLVNLKPSFLKLFSLLFLVLVLEKKRKRISNNQKKISFSSLLKMGLKTINWKLMKLEWFLKIKKLWCKTEKKFMNDIRFVYCIMYILCIVMPRIYVFRTIRYRNFFLEFHIEVSWNLLEILLGS
jgi:hypothetical protein